MKKNAAFVSLIMISMLLFTGCSQKAVISIDEEKIDSAEYGSYLNNTKKAIAQIKGDSFLEENIIDIKKEVSENIISDRLVYLASTDKASDEDIGVILEGLKKGYTKEEFDITLNEMGLTEVQLLKRLKISETVKKEKQRVLSQKQITQDMANDYFNKNKKNLMEKIVNGNINIFHVMLKTIDEDQNPLPEDQIKAKEIIAKDILDRAVKKEDFKALSLNYSEDELTKSNSGYLGIIDNNFPIKELSDAAKSIELSDEFKIYPEVVKSKYGFHILKIEKVSNVEFKDVESQVVEIMKEAEFDNYINFLRNSSKITIDEKQIDDIN